MGAMTADPNVLAAAQSFLQFYVTGDGTALQLPSVQGLRRRRPALQGPPLEFIALERDPGASEDPAVFLADMSGVEDFLLIDGSDHVTLVLFWCTDYPSSALTDEFPGVSAQRIELSTTAEAQMVALECVEKLQGFLSEDFEPLELECQLELIPFEELAAAKLAASGPNAPSVIQGP